MDSILQAFEAHLASVNDLWSHMLGQFVFPQQQSLQTKNKTFG
jgi:hypothetical protein